MNDKNLNAVGLQFDAAVSIWLKPQMFDGITRWFNQTGPGQFELNWLGLSECQKVCYSLGQAMAVVHEQMLPEDGEAGGESEEEDPDGESEEEDPDVIQKVYRIQCLYDWTLPISKRASILFVVGFCAPNYKNLSNPEKEVFCYKISDSFDQQSAYSLPYKIIQVREFKPFHRYMSYGKESSNFFAFAKPIADIAVYSNCDTPAMEPAKMVWPIAAKEHCFYPNFGTGDIFDDFDQRQ